MIDFLIFLHLFAELLVQEPIYTIAFLLGALLFVKWVFYAPDIEDDEFVVNIKQHKNVQEILDSTNMHKLHLQN